MVEFQVVGCKGADWIRVFAIQIRTPPPQARSGETLQTRHWRVCLTRFHLIGSIPYFLLKTKKQRNYSVAVSFIGAGDGNRTHDLQGHNLAL